MSNYKIIINKNGEPRLVECPEKPTHGHGDVGINYLTDQYEQALSKALQDESKHIAFKDIEQAKRIINPCDCLKGKSLCFMPCGHSYDGWPSKHIGQTFDLPTGYHVYLTENSSYMPVAELMKCECTGPWDCQCPNYGSSPPESVPSPKGEQENLYSQLKSWLSEKMLNPDWTWQQITKDDGQYFAINDGKRFAGFNHDLKFGKTWFGIREDGNTRTVFNGTVETLEDAKRIWELTTH